MGKNNGKRKARTDYSVRVGTLKRVDNYIKEKEQEVKSRKRKG